MRSNLVRLTGALGLFAIAACNAAQQGANDRVLFTPRACGNPLLDCTFDRPVAHGGFLEVQIRGVDGASVTGLDVASSNPGILSVIRAPEVGGVPSWQLHGATVGAVTLRATDAGAEVDFIDVSVVAPTRLGLVKIAGTAVGPTDEDGVDQAWTVTADQLVSFQVLPYATNTHLMGRLDYATELPAGSTLLATEQSSSDRTQGYLYVQPPAGDYPFSFALAADSTIAVDAVIHAR